MFVFVFGEHLFGKRFVRVRVRAPMFVFEGVFGLNGGSWSDNAVRVRSCFKTSLNTYLLNTEGFGFKTFHIEEIGVQAGFEGLSHRVQGEISESTPWWEVGWEVGGGMWEVGGGRWGMRGGIWELGYGRWQVGHGISLRFPRTRWDSPSKPA